MESRSNALIARKLANALFPDAEIAPGLVSTMNYVTLGLAAPSLKFFRRVQGGLWVGGEILLDDQRLVFRPNSINRTFHASNLTQVLPLSDVTAVRCRFGLLSGIIDVDFNHKLFTFRCFGSKAFAQTIRGAVAAGNTN